MWYNIITVKDRSPKMKGIEIMGIEKIKVVDYEGKTIAIINETDDYDYYLDQLEPEEQEKLFSAMNQSMSDNNVDIIVNKNNFSDIMCDWQFEHYEDEEDEDEDITIFFYHYTADHKIPNADYYTIQYIVDGFGNDSYVSRSFKTKEEVIAYAEENGIEKINIIPQWFGEEFNNIHEYEYDCE